ncbi:MAG: sigma-70 family RNA polymerase sigma factor [Pseudonocardia sp.]|nr:sigma-70 family RNA polymerase sigma factor [Pseudonocardia sp.]
MSALAEDDLVGGETDGDAVRPADAAVPAGVEQDRPSSGPGDLRADFGAHFEAHYPRLVAQLFAITLDSGEAHELVQDAYSRAWRRWSDIGRGPDPAGWVRRVAVRSSMRSWRRLLSRAGLRSTRIPDSETVDPRTRAVLHALARLGAPERRSIVLRHMAGMPTAEIAALEGVSAGAVQARLARADHVVAEGMADVLPQVLGVEPVEHRVPSAHEAYTGLYDRGYEWTDDEGTYR